MSDDIKDILADDAVILIKMKACLDETAPSLPFDGLENLARHLMRAIAHINDLEVENKLYMKHTDVRGDTL